MNPPAAGAQPFADEAALSALATEAANEGAAPTPGAEARQSSAAQNRTDAMMVVAVGLGLVSKVVKQTKGITVTFGKETLDEGIDAVAPLLAKHGGAMPPWLKQYREELVAGAFAANVAFQVWLAIKEASASTAPPQPQTGRVHEEA